MKNNEYFTAEVSRTEKEFKPEVFLPAFYG
jgi:hypothetical protein